MERRRQLYMSKKRLRRRELRGICRLPVEMMCKIAAFLDDSDIFNLARTCKQFYSVIWGIKSKRYLLYFPLHRTITMLCNGRHLRGRPLDPMDLVHCANDYRLLKNNQKQWRRVLCILFWEKDCVNYMQHLKCPQNIQMLDDLNLTLYAIAMLTNRPFLLDIARERYGMPFDLVIESDENSINTTYYPSYFTEKHAIWCLSICRKKDMCIRVLTAKCIQHDWHRALAMMHPNAPLSMKRVLSCPGYLESLDLTSGCITKDYLYRLFATSDSIPLRTRHSALVRYAQDAKSGSCVNLSYAITTKKLKVILQINLPELAESCIQLLHLIIASNRLVAENGDIVNMLYPRYSIYLFPYCFHYISITREQYYALLNLPYKTPMGIVSDTDARRHDLRQYGLTITY